MDRDNGGAVFPRPSGGTLHEGMSLRDYFASQALAGMIASYTGADLPLPERDHAAITAYEYADAMLKAREEG